VEEEYGLGVVTSLTYEQAVSRTRLSLAVEGFRILSESPSPPRIGESVGRLHLFMGVWARMVGGTNLGGPGLDVGDHLQCNVAVFEEGDDVVVALLDPTEGLEGWSAPSLAEEAREALGRMLERVAS
jgi:hypothetical protein